MIPFFEAPELPTLGERARPFGLLLFASALVAYRQLARSAERRGLASRRACEALALTAVVGAALGGHLVGLGLGVLGGAPVFLAPWELGVSSVGAMAGAALAALGFARVRRLDVLGVADAAAEAFPAAWLVARFGCALAHDHLGRASSSLFALALPSGPRFDLGLLEWLAMPPLLALTLWFAKRRLPRGALAGSVALAYASLRFGIEELAEPAAETSSFVRAACVAGAGFGLLLLAASRRPRLAPLEAPGRAEASRKP